MGRKTFETLDKPLPKRTNIIVTRNADYQADGCIVVNSIEDALDEAKKVAKDEICIVGGGEIYKLGLPFSNRIELTRVHGHFNGGDAFFPEFDLHEWELQSEIYHSKDQKHPHDFTYLTYIRR